MPLVFSTVSRPLQPAILARRKPSQPSPRERPGGISRPQQLRLVSDEGNQMMEIRTGGGEGTGALNDSLQSSCSRGSAASYAKPGCSEIFWRV